MFEISLDVFSDECSTFLDMLNDMGIDKKQQPLEEQITSFVVEIGTGIAQT